MATDSDVKHKYNDNLSGRIFTLNCQEIGGSSKATFMLSFSPSNFDHLLGVGTQHYEKKRAVLPMLLEPSTWKMCGEYNNNMGVNLEADIVVGGTTGCLGFRENEDGMYYPCTCLQGDIRNLVYPGYYKIVSVGCATLG